jgi:hypothetical protein
MDHRPDPIILAWAASNERVLVTGDLNTMVGFAWSRVQSGEPMPGVLALLENIGVGRVIDDILLVALCCAAGDDFPARRLTPSLVGALQLCKRTYGFGCQLEVLCVCLQPYALES